MTPFKEGDLVFFACWILHRMSTWSSHPFFKDHLFCYLWVVHALSKLQHFYTSRTLPTYYNISHASEKIHSRHIGFMNTVSSCSVSDSLTPEHAAIILFLASLQAKMHLVGGGNFTYPYLKMDNSPTQACSQAWANPGVKQRWRAFVDMK